MSKKELVIVSCSGGLDSSVSAAILKFAKYKNILLVHFKYGHRGQNCEEIAIKNIAKELDLPLKIIDVENIYNTIDVKDVSMLSNNEAIISTGTHLGLKTVHAWTPGRNMLFMTIMGIIAETEVMRYDFNSVYFVGGWMNLSESGIYPDNSEAFCSSCLNMFNFGTLIGNRIKPMYCLSNLLKSDHYILVKEFKLQNIIKNSISCDRPQLVNGIPCNCMKDGLPACGSGALSLWGSRIAGMDDMKIRSFYEVDDPDYKLYTPSHMKKDHNKITNINNIIDRILLPPDKLDNLRKLVKV